MSTAAPLQSALDSAGYYSSHIEWVWWVFFWVSAVVYVAVIAAMLYAALHRRRGSGELESEKKATIAVSVAVGLTVVTLFGLLLSSIFTGRSIAAIPEEPKVRLELTAKQWWWQIDYDDADKSKRFTTANEIYIPVGVPVMVRLRSSDVIHSFWVPNLHGKKDVIPGRDGGIVLKADKAGVYRGQCAEFCGVEHAKMAFWVNAVPLQDYARWADRQRQEAKMPTTIPERQGQEIFMSSPCPLCHTIAGTDASGKSGPDLTHFASRRSIAAGTVPNRRGYLGAWIVDPQHIKPGNYMPPMPLEKGQLDPLLTYLESLE